VNVLALASVLAAVIEVRLAHLEEVDGEDRRALAVGHLEAGHEGIGAAHMQRADVVLAVLGVDNDNCGAAKPSEESGIR